LWQNLQNKAKNRPKDTKNEQTVLDTRRQKTEISEMRKLGLPMTRGILFVKIAHNTKMVLPSGEVK